MKTERTMELLNEFKTNGIPSNGKRFNLVLEYQDCVMQATPGDIAKFERGLDTEERNIFFWVNSSTLAMDSFLEILKSTYIRRKTQDIVGAELEKEDERYSAMFAKVHNERDALESRIEKFEGFKKPIHKRISNLKTFAEQFKRLSENRQVTIDALQADNARLRACAVQNQQKARNFDTLKELLA